MRRHHPLPQGWSDPTCWRPTRASNARAGWQVISIDRLSPNILDECLASTTGRLGRCWVRLLNPDSTYIKIDDNLATASRVWLHGLTDGPPISPMLRTTRPAGPTAAYAWAAGKSFGIGDWFSPPDQIGQPHTQRRYGCNGGVDAKGW